MENKINKTKSYIKDNQDLLFTTVDKDNATVYIPRDEYIKKWKQALVTKNIIKFWRGIGLIKLKIAQKNF